MLVATRPNTGYVEGALGCLTVCYAYAAKMDVSIQALEVEAGRMMTAFYSAY
jgi:hypothetical protein